MKKRILTLSTVILAILFTVVSNFAQDEKKMKMENEMMSKMQNSPHHMLMMAHRQNVLNFAKVLRGMTEDGNLEDADMARAAFAEIKNSSSKMEEIHQTHMSKMTAETREKMMPMMEKMQAEKTAMKEHIRGLETALQATTPDAREVEKHAAALVEQLEKMKMPDKKMKMPDKKQM